MIGKLFLLFLFELVVKLPVHLLSLAAFLLLWVGRFTRWAWGGFWHLPLEVLRPRIYTRRFTAWAIFAMMAGSLLVHSNTWWNGYHYDDGVQIRRNAHIRDLRNIPKFFTDFTTQNMDPVAFGKTYRPLTLVSFAINYAIYGYDVSTFHILNYFLHTGAGIAIFLLFGFLVEHALPQKGGRGGGLLEYVPLSRRLYAPPWLGLLAGFLFVVHPLGTESLNYLSARGDLLGTFFYYVGLLCYVAAGYGERNPDWNRGPRLFVLLGAMLAGFAAMLSKELGITFIGAVILFDLCFLPRWSLRAYLRRFACFQLPMIGITAGYLLLRIDRLGELSDGRTIRTLYNNIVTQCVVFWKYIWRLFVPWPLNVDYDQKVYNVNKFTEKCGDCTAVEAFWKGVENWGRVLKGMFASVARTDPEKGFWKSIVTDPYFWPVVSVIALLLLLLLTLWLYRSKRHRDLAFAILLFLNTQAPTSIKPLKIIMNDHRPYIGIISVCLFLALLFGRFLAWYDARSRQRRVVVPTGAQRCRFWENLPVIALIAVVLFILSTSALFYGLPPLFPGSGAGRFLLTYRPWLGKIHLMLVFGLIPLWILSRLVAGFVLALSGESPPDPESYRRRRLHRIGGTIAALLLLTYASMTHARNYLWRDDYALWGDSVEKSPNKSRPHLNYGLALSRKGRKEEAIQEYKRSLAIRPNYSLAHKNLAHVYKSLGMYDEAIVHFRRVTHPKYRNNALLNLGRVYWLKGERDKAMQTWERLARSAPDDKAVQREIEKHKKLLEREKRLAALGKIEKTEFPKPEILSPAFEKWIDRLQIGIGGRKTSLDLETSDFANDETIRIITRWKKRPDRKKHKIFWRFYDPSGNLFHEIEQNVKENWVAAWANFGKRNERPKGRWKLEMEMDGELVYRTFFDILTDPVIPTGRSGEKPEQGVSPTQSSPTKAHPPEGEKETAPAAEESEPDEHPAGNE